MRKGSESSGLPIAANLALMLALAFAAAFVVSVAVIIWLPPRPPDVVRGDQLVERFVRGFEEAKSAGRAPHGDAMEWRVDSRPPSSAPSLPARMLQVKLARALTLSPERVRIAAEAARADMFVYRVRNLDHHIEVHGVQVIQDNDQVRVLGPHSRVTHTTEFELRHEPAPIAPPTPNGPPGAGAPEPPPLFAPAPEGVVLLSGFEIGAQLPDGHWLVMKQGRNWAAIGWIGRAALVVGATLALLTLLAFYFARGLARPIQGFADAVQAVGVDPQSAPVAERGPREMRSAARAVNSMQARLRALIADRTKTLATVAHDMRTPLMRLRLSAENAEPALRDKMAKDIADVEALVASFISFARDDPAEEARVRIDLAALLQSLVDDQSASGHEVSFEGEQRLVITGQSLGLKRLFSNLIDNALKYGGAARVSLTQVDASAMVEVEDDGPGIPAAQRESAFTPFVRLSAAAGGAGLGLPAARSIARAHGGDIVFLDADHGARVRVNLPL